jgi:hypothetical protein
MTEADISAAPRRVALGVVVYRPEATLLQRLRLALGAGFAVYLFDNSPEMPACRDFARTHAGCHYSTCGKNLGLGVGISAVCSQAWHDGQPALVFFDQDTVFDTKTLAFIEQFHASHTDMARTYSAVVFNARRAHAPVTEPALRDVTMAISSGTMFFLANLQRMNWHNATYFVDCVDYEFCLNSAIHGLRIAEYSRTPGFDHLAEQPDRVYRFLGRDHAIRRYSASRIRDACGASLRLSFAAIRAGKPSFFAIMARSLAIYLFFQLVARLLPGQPSQPPVVR